jgi:hypothetical protein
MSGLRNRTKVLPVPALQSGTISVSEAIEFDGDFSFAIDARTDTARRTDVTFHTVNDVCVSARC